MKRCGSLIVAVGILALAFDTAHAQRPGRRPGDGTPGERSSEGPRRPPAPPIVAALDTDQDGVISAQEIENAVAALKTLDKNNDGKLTDEEIRPQGGFGRGFGGFGGFGSGRGFGGPGGPGGAPAQSTADRVARLMENDKNKDGKLTKDEVEERTWQFLARADDNEDGVLEKSELEAMMQRFSQGRPGGEGSRGTRRPGGDGAGGRPQRPQRPSSDQE